MTEDRPGFGNLRVAAFESRRADDMRRLIERHGGQAFVSPSLREVSIDANPAAVDFAHRVMAGEVDAVVLMTGVGTRLLVDQVKKNVDQPRFVAALSDVTTVARGPKPAAALRELGITPTHCVPQPNTWREVLLTCERNLQLENLTVGLQEYGESSLSLIAGLEARGARVINVKVYRWDLPDDTRPLEENIRRIVRNEIDVALFTSAQQVINTLRLAAQLGVEGPFRNAMKRVIVGSIGPTTSETLRECELPVDLEPTHSKMGHLVAEMAEKSPELVSRNKGTRFVSTAYSAGEVAPAWHDSPFMRACRLERNERVPIWLMRQAGRYLPEYRKIREKTTFLELCKNPELCAEVMITTVNRLGVDAAIIFSDLLPILEPMGFELEFGPDSGPRINNPIRTAEQVRHVRELQDAGQLDFVMKTVRLTRAGLNEQIPVIGFAGAPFTLASYAIEGQGSRDYLLTKQFMHLHPKEFGELLGKLSRSITTYLKGQINAGAQAVQIFDSWVGCLSPSDYERHVLPHSKAIFEGLGNAAPAIHFATGNPALLPMLAAAGGHVIGVDWRISLDDARAVIGPNRAIQGNLDPAILFADFGATQEAATAILQQGSHSPGHIFNLGHGVLKSTPVDHVLRLIELVHEWRA